MHVNKFFFLSWFLSSSLSLVHSQFVQTEFDRVFIETYQSKIRAKSNDDRIKYQSTEIGKEVDHADSLHNVEKARPSEKENIQGKLRAYAGDANEHTSTCAIQEKLDNDGVLCPFFSTFLKLDNDDSMVATESSAMTNKAPISLNVELPQILDDLRPMPVRISKDVYQSERPTYYWYYRLILNLYNYVQNTEKDTNIDTVPENLLPIVPDGWNKLGKYLHRALPREAPLIMSIVKGDHASIIFRGTSNHEEWLMDFTYQWADEKDSSQYFPGKIHKGYLTLFKLFESELLTTLQEYGLGSINHITIAGHSLGGALSGLFGYYLSDQMTELGFGHIAIDVISFGSPSISDLTYAIEYDKKINHRHITYGGQQDSENTGHQYVGDVIAQIPCGKVSSCSALPGQNDPNTPPFFEYHPLGGVVQFTYMDLPNSGTWSKKNDWNNLLQYAPEADHICSYICWTASAVGDAENRCYFLFDFAPSVSMSNRCLLNFKLGKNNNTLAETE